MFRDLRLYCRSYLVRYPYILLWVCISKGMDGMFILGGLAGLNVLYPRRLIF
jgi:hypothetical protein